jgi:hypothetical protein
MNLNKIGSINNMNKTLCILGNSKVGDLYASKIVSQLKTKFGLSDIQLIGNGGEHMKKTHGMNSIVDLDDLREKVLYLWRYNQKSFLNFKFHPMNYYQHVLLRTNTNLLKSMEENQVYENLMRARPSCILGLDNEHLSQEMVRRIHSKYNEKFSLHATRKNRPDTYIMTNTVRNWDENYKIFCDMAFYTLALKQINKKWFVFPSHYIGQYGAYEALRHLMLRAGMTDYVKGNSILFSREHSFDQIEKARTIVREDFRIRLKIDPEATCVFLAPGNTIEENKYTLEAFRLAYNEFITRYSYPSSLSHYAPPREMFKLIVSVQSGTESEEYVRNFLKSSEYLSEVIIVSDKNNEHFDAMASSDFGCVYNGQLVSSAASLHLHCFTMQNMNDLHYFWHTWENRWLAELNVNADRPAIKEYAAGEFWKGKLCDELSYY